MLSNILSATTIARHIISVSLLAGAATTMVAGSADSVAAVTHRTEPVAATEPQGDLEDLVKDCFARYTAAKNSAGDAARASEACRKAIEASGLSPEDFWKKFGKPEPQKPTESKKPETPSTNADLEALVKDCIAKYTNAAKSPEGYAAAKEVCMRAIEASGLTPEEFFKKYLRHEPKPEPTPQTRPTALLKACVTTAAQLTGDSSREDIEKAAAICAKAKTIFDH